MNVHKIPIDLSKKQILHIISPATGDELTQPEIDRLTDSIDAWCRDSNPVFILASTDEYRIELIKVDDDAD